MNYMALRSSVCGDPPVLETLRGHQKKKSTACFCVEIHFLFRCIQSLVSKNRSQVKKGTAKQREKMWFLMQRRYEKKIARVTR